MAYCRAGDWDAARSALERSVDLRGGGNSFDWFFLATACSKRGQKAQAQTWFDRAVLWRDKNLPDDPELKRFCAEAGALIKNAGTPLSTTGSSPAPAHAR